MNKHLLSFFLFGLIICSHRTAGQNIPALKAQYNFPATDWESEALPLGNGFIGAMVFGDVATDIIQMNEHSIWSGGPGKNPDYDGGHRKTAAVNQQYYQQARMALQADMVDFSNTKAAYVNESGKVIAQNYPNNAQTKAYIDSLKGTKADFGSYQSLGDIRIAYTSIVIPEIDNIDGDCDNPDKPGESFPMLFDNKPTTKWYSDKGFKGFPCHIAWKYNNLFPVSAYTLISGNDTPGRDPKAWNLYGSNNGESYTLIDSQSDIVFQERRQSITFNLSQTVTYKYFKFEITATANGNPPQLSEIALENANVAHFPAYTDYSRKLDIERAVSTVTYAQDGTNYSREYFVSHPDNVLVIRLTADKPGSLSRTIRITTPQTNKNISSAGSIITMQGKPADQGEAGLKFAQQIKVIPSGGAMTTSNSQITVENADEILIISSAATNYQQCMDDTYNYFSTTNPLDKVSETIDAASQKSYSQLLNDHVNDYQSLYNRMNLNLGDAANTNNKNTDDLLAGYKNNTNTPAENLYLEQLYYQFGRYLLISSSRKSGLPANLQGIWADGLTPPWNADYHTNINIQMNYWLAEQTNLADCHWPAIDFVKSLVPRGKYTAQQYFCKQDGSPVRGWVDFHENNIWGNTGPATSGAFYFPAAAGWLCQDIWEYYLFNQDKTFLEEYYPLIRDAALFWVDNLWLDSRDDTWVASPSYSPEHGPYSLGASCDQAIITELFDMAIQANKILKRNPAEVEEITAIKGKLAGPRIGLAGQFMEWKDETTMDISGDGGHRHVNHLFWLHPGSQIVTGRSLQEDLYAEAMKKTLNTRGDGGTGWSKAWKINFWARLRDGNHAHKLLEELLKQSTLNNLFDTHPPFQIDGNFGATAGMTEMLVQSQGGAIEILPALPDTWTSGSFKGIKARGNFELSAQWKNGQIVSLEIISNSGNNCVVKYKDIHNYILTKQGGGNVSVSVVDNNTLSFETIPGETYIVRLAASSIPIVEKTSPEIKISHTKNKLIVEKNKPGEVQIDLYNIAGEKIKSITDNFSADNKKEYSLGILSHNIYLAKVSIDKEICVSKILITE
jgi:hypothetical protein